MATEEPPNTARSEELEDPIPTLEWTTPKVVAGPSQYGVIGEIPSKRSGHTLTISGTNGFMFGGYLMRRALEVAWLSAYRFARQPPTFVGLDDVVFRKPVEVGRLVEYIGRVVYAGEDGSLRVIVKAHRLSLRTGRTDPTNQFHFIFRPSS